MHNVKIHVAKPGLPRAEGSRSKSLSLNGYAATWRQQLLKLLYVLWDSQIIHLVINQRISSVDSHSFMTRWMSRHGHCWQGKVGFWLGTPLLGHVAKLTKKARAKLCRFWKWLLGCVSCRHEHRLHSDWDHIMCLWCPHKNLQNNTHCQSRLCAFQPRRGAWFCLGRSNVIATVPGCQWACSAWHSCYDVNSAQLNMK